MLMVLFSWIVIAGAAFIFGKTIVDLIYRKHLRCMGKPDIYIVTGIAFLTVYAQLFSIFYKVAGIACTILGAVGIILTVSYAAGHLRRGEKMNLLPGAAGWKTDWWRALLLFLCLISTLLWTTQDPGQYDTGLYHAQAIRWLEEYGVVPGLGNLHMRFAYNSAFLCLQALFSLEWLVGQSVHSMNGFLCLCALLYAFGTVRTPGKERWQTSDLLKGVMVIYVVNKRYSVASPGTDLWAMLLIVYICTKWCEFTESGEKETAPWCYVCLVGFYALTVKLSAAAIVILVLYPLCLLIRKRDFKGIAYNAILAIIIVAPYLIRNVIISGYLVYPYAGIDLFSVDWKMNPQVLIEDSKYNLTMWARGFQDVASYSRTYEGKLFAWMPHWFLIQETSYRILTVTGAVCAVLVLFHIVRYGKRRDYEYAAILGASVVSLLFWLMAAPLMRYGQVYLFIIIAFALGGWDRKALTPKRDILAAAGSLVMLALLFFFAGKFREAGGTLSEYWLRQPPYGAWPATQTKVENVIIWEPDEDLIGYPAFPSTAQADQLSHLKLRGDGFEDGFRYMEKPWRE